jgi:hypothetical protein
MNSKKKKAWYYWRNPNDKKWYILAFVNAKKRCRLRCYEPINGNRDKDAPIRDGDFQEAFSEYFDSTHFLINLSRQPNLEKEAKISLPPWVLLEVRKQVKEMLISLLISLDC